MLYETSILRETNAGDTTVQNKCQFLVSYMERHYLLALLLTASEEDAESCFVLALDTWSKAFGNLVPIAQDVAHTSMRRALVDSAIRICDPVFSRVPGKSEPDNWNAKSASPDSSLITAILQLDAFERFVFVLSVLESYSDKECANLLHCQPEEIVECRIRAIYSLAASQSMEVSEQPLHAAKIRTWFSSVGI